jgi:hypothetical protein
LRHFAHKDAEVSVSRRQPPSRQHAVATRDAMRQLVWAGRSTVGSLMTWLRKRPRLSAANLVQSDGPGEAVKAENPLAEAPSEAP